MNILKWFGIGSKSKKPKVVFSEGSCPVCWGHQQFDGKVRILYEDKEIDYKNHKNKYVRSLKFQKDNIDGHRRNKGEIITCPTCASKNKK